MVINASLDILISKTSPLSYAFSLSLLSPSLSLLWWPLYVLTVIQRIWYHQLCSPSLSLSLSSDDIICVDGYPTHMISPALLSLSLTLLWWPLYVLTVIQRIWYHQLCSPFLSLSCDDIICVDSYPTHMISPVLLSLSLSLLWWPLYGYIYIILLDTFGGRYF